MTSMRLGMRPIWKTIPGVFKSSMFKPKTGAPNVCKARQTRGVFVGRANPQIHIAGRANVAVKRHRVAADHEKFNALGDKRG